MTRQFLATLAVAGVCASAAAQAGAQAPYARDPKQPVDADYSAKIKERFD